MSRLIENSIVNKHKTEANTLCISNADALPQTLYSKRFQPVCVCEKVTQTSEVEHQIALVGVTTNGSLALQKKKNMQRKTNQPARPAHKLSWY